MANMESLFMGSIAQIAVDDRRIEVLDLWSEDTCTKQDAWFSQSALDVGFARMKKAFPNFQVYLFFWLVFCQPVFMEV